MLWTGLAGTLDAALFFLDNQQLPDIVDTYQRGIRIDGGKEKGRDCGPAENTG